MVPIRPVMGVAVKIQRRTALRFAAAPFALAAALVATAAQAQGQDQPEQSPAASDEIIVTGTRIRDLAQTGREPIARIDASYLADRNLFNLAEALNEAPGVRGSITPNGAQAPFGQGANFANLYNLGVNRTLTLVDGRRVVSSNVPLSAPGTTPGTSVDLNVIPTILIERVDLLSVGGAPVYGTDAIAGTINVILKRRMHGLQAEATSGITQEGDNQRLALSAAGGFDFADGRANLTGAISWSRVDGVLANDRWFYRANVFNLTNPSSAQIPAFGTPGRTAATDGRLNSGIGYNNGASDGNPGTVLVRDAYFWQLARGGLVLNPSIPALVGTVNGSPANGNLALGRFDAAGNIVAYNPGIVYPGGRTSGGDGYRPNDFAPITSTLERLNTAAFFTYEVSDGLRFFAEGMWSHSRGDQLTTGSLNNAITNGGANGFLTFSVNNPMLSSQARQWLTSHGYNTEFVLSRTDADLVDNSGMTTSDVYRVVGGIEGRFVLGGRNWNYEAYVNYGRADVVDRLQDINQQNFINAINGCSTISTVKLNLVPTAPVADAACVPLSLFGDGVASPQALAYIRQNTVSRSRLEQTVANVNVGGSPFDLNGNAVSLNFGFEHHTETARFTPDQFIQLGRGRAAPVQPVSGSYRMNEEFAEVLVPFVTPANNGPISRLEAFGRFRNVDNSTNGAFQAWSAGGVFAPVSDLELRGNFTRSFRAPSVVELYSLRTQGNVTVPDLCSVANVNAGPAPAVRAANCAAFLAKYPAGLSGTPTGGLGVQGFFGGNPNLRNEVANSFTYGVVLRPRFVPRLTLSVDYVNIKITAPITQQLASSIASSCFDNPSFNTADPANGNLFCALIPRDANGRVVDGVVTGYINGQRIHMDAIQAALGWTAPVDLLGAPGMVGLDATAFFLRNRLVDVTGVAPVQSEGLVGDPKFQGQVRLRYENAAWGLATNVNVTGAQALFYTQRGPAPNDIREFDHYDAFATVDSSVWFKAGSDFRLTLSVTNLFNRIGQSYHGYLVPASASMSGSINDALGRRFAISVRKTY